MTKPKMLLFIFLMLLTLVSALAQDTLKVKHIDTTFRHRQPFEVMDSIDLKLPHSILRCELILIEPKKMQQ